MKSSKGIFFVIAFAILLTACGDHMSSYNIDGDHRFHEMAMHEALALLDEEFEGIFYFGFPGCPWCQAAVPAIHEASQIVGVDILYISRSHTIRDTEGWEEADAKMAWWLNEQIEMGWLYENEVPIRPNIFVPHVVHIRNGVVVNNHQGTFEGHERLADDSLPELTDIEYLELLENYIRIFTVVNPAE